MYFEDLTDYNYFRSETSKNIGWLDIEHTYSKGKVSEQFIKNLWIYLSRYVFMARGYHVCNLCSFPLKGVFLANYKGETIKLGYAEIRVFSEDGKVTYAAPNLIYHYITDHEYKPPEEFIKAVIEGPKPGTLKYDSYIAGLKL